MNWFKLDVGVGRHPKIRAANRQHDGAPWLWVASIAYCQKHLTDGRFGIEELPALSPGFRDPDGAAEILCDVGLWELDGPAGEYVVNDYLEHNKSRAEVEAESRRKRAAARKGGRAGGSK